ncbi:MAG: metallophosphoesterase [Deltaproteobacteria bacterium]|nr:metallophosphoesterase [Deltaproteobacteria bacterium]NNK13154.1 metallophosphoesterase [Desulfofustis sp.]NNK58129.1 metallophosphoesterase [Desulfofustis sp.]
MKRRRFLKSTLYSSAFALVGFYPIFIERRKVLVNRYKIPIADLPPSFNGFTLAHLTDIHLGSFVSKSFVEEIVHTTNSLGADVIVCTGDYVMGGDTTEQVDTVWPILSKLKSKHGVYSVLGNHDHHADSNRSLYWLERSEQDIRHKCKPIYKGKERVIIGGSGDYWYDRLDIDNTFSCTDERDCRLLLSHNPDAIDTQFDTPLALVMSGHTHGGQVVIPFFGPPILPVKNKNYSSGLITTAKTKLFISRGIGCSGLPVRFNCYPEIAILELVNPQLT